MKAKSHLAALTCAALLGSVALSQAAVVVSENFTDANVGFSTAWSDLTVVSGVATANNASLADLSYTFSSTGTLWVSFDWGYSTAPTEGGSYGGLSFFNGTSEKLLIGNTWTAPTPNGSWSMNGAGDSGVSNTGLKTGVAKITLGGAGANNDIVELWVGATGSSVDVSGAALLTATGRDLEGVNRLRIHGFDYNGTPGNFDNLVIGTTMADVAAIPEPSAALLGGLGMLALLRRRRA